MKCSALNADFNGVRIDLLGSRSPLYERIKFGYPLENMRFLLLSTNLAREWLQIDTHLLRIITRTADGLSGVPTRGVHGSGKPHGNPIPMGIPWEWE